MGGMGDTRPVTTTPLFRRFWKSDPRWASLAFSLLPRLARGPGQMVRANGLLAQCGASGSLLGPPTMAACVQAGGWSAAALAGLGVSLVALPLAWRAATAAAQTSAATEC